MEAVRNALVIDDEKEIGTLLSRMLKRMGYKVKVASTLNDGYSTFIEEIPQIVFLDVNFPEGSGLDLLPKLKERSNQTRIILISSELGYGKARMANSELADTFIGKPFDKQKVEMALLQLRMVN